MKLEFINSWKKIIFISLGLGLITIAILPYSWIGIAVIIISLNFFVLGEKYLLPFSIILFLVMTSDFTENYRNYLNAFLILLLFYLFIKNYGISIKSFAGFPKEVNYIIALNLGSMLISSIFSENILYTLLVTARQIIFFIIVYIFFTFLSDKKNIFNYINSLIIVSVILGVVIFYEIFTRGLSLFSLQSHSFNQFSGLYSNPNAVGLLLNVSIPIMVGAALIQRSKQNNYKYFYYTVLAFLSVVLLLTDSRASIGAVFISIIFILWRLRTKYLKIIFYSIIVMTLLVVFIPVLNEYAGIYFRVGRIFENTRYDIWDMTINMIKKNYLFGVGPDLFQTKIYSFLPVKLGSFEEHQIWWARSGTAHNFFLFKFAETGVLGLASAVYLFFVFFKLSFKVEDKIKSVDKEYYLMSIAISSVGVGLLGRAFLESTGLTTNGWITRDLPFWLVFIIIIYFYQNFVLSKKN